MWNARFFLSDKYQRNFKKKIKDVKGLQRRRSVRFPLHSTAITGNSGAFQGVLREIQGGGSEAFERRCKGFQ